MSTEANDYLTLEVIAGTAFRSTADTDELSQRVKDRLGFGSYNIPARLAMARSLALPGQPPKAEGEVGRIIKGDVLFGTGADLASWVSLLIEHAGSALTIKDLQSTVQRHWARGMKILSEELDASDGDNSEFWRRLAENALPEVTEKRRSQAASVVAEASRGPVPVRLGEIGRDVATNEEVIWTLNAPGGSPHSAFMGGVGSGKTRTAAFVLRSIAEQTNVPLLAFDFKGDMADRNNALDRAFGAQVLSPPMVPIPLDVFALKDRSELGIINAVQRLRDSFSSLKQTKFGDLQRRRLNNALEQAVRTKNPCTLSDVRDCLTNIYASDGAKEDGAIATFEDLCRLPLFEPKMSPEEFFSKSWIISLPANVPELVRVTVVALLTDALERFINSQQDSETDSDGNRSLRVICVIDEAHRALEAKLPALSNLIRQGRSKGAAVMLISQKPDDFEGVDDDFLDEMGLVACFVTNARESSVKRILGAGASLTSLKTGEAFVRARGAAKARKVLAWK